MANNEISIDEAKEKLVAYAESERYYLETIELGLNKKGQKVISAKFKTTRHDGADSRMLTFFNLQGWRQKNVHTDQFYYWVDLTQESDEN